MFFLEACDIIKLGEAILSGYQATYSDALKLTTVEDADVPLAAAYANKIRLKYAGDHVDMCGIVNARSGMCSEDCKFCAQSVYHDTHSPVYPLRNKQELVACARQVEADGAARISLVTSGKGMQGDADFSRIVETIRYIMESTRLKVCANLGTIDSKQAVMLAQAGVKRYAHNLETSKRYYPFVCTTHPYEERLATIYAAKKAGMELCSGGIIGMGETWQDRIDMAFLLREIAPQSIPVNILNPIKGTMMESYKPPQPLEIIKTFAIFRFILPDKIIRAAGGREMNLRDMQGTVMLAGVNGLIIGNYLTFGGRNAAADFKMVYDAGLNPHSKY